MCATSRSRWLRLVALAATVALLTLTACSDDEGSSPDPTTGAGPLAQIRDATFAQRSASYSGETRFADGAAGPIDGTSQAEPPAGEVTHPVMTPTGPQPVTFLWDGSDLYVRRAVTGDTGTVSATLRLEGDPPWTRSTYQPLAVALFDAYDPFRLLDRLVALDRNAERQGAETVDGTDLERYVVDLSDLPVAPAGARTVEMLTDDQQVLQVVRLSGDTTIEYRLADFGVEVAPSPPPADQVGTSLARPSVTPTGPFEVVAQGSSEFGGWTLLSAPGTDDGRCWRLDTETPLDAVSTTQADGVTCFPAVDPDAVADEQVRVVADAGSGAGFDAVAVAVPAGTTDVSLQFADGTRTDLPVDPAGVVVWLGPKEPLALVLEVTTPDGAVVSCSPGSVIELDDLQLLSEAERAALDRAPWLCLEL